MLGKATKMNRLFHKAKENWLIIVIAVLALLVAFLPYMQSGLVKGSDYNFHIARIDSLREDLRNGFFPVKIHSVLCFDYGYGVGFFYPNFFLYIPAFLCLLGLSLETAYKMFAALVFFGLFSSMYYSVWKLGKDKYAALFAAVCYVLSVPILNSFYHAFTMGSSLGAVFMPFAIAGMLEFCEKDKKPILLGIGFWGMIYSHILSTYISFIVCLCILLFYWKKVILKPKRLLALGFTAGTSAALSVSFWGPMLEQLKAQTLNVQRPWARAEDHVLSIENVLGDKQGWFVFILTVMIGAYIFKYRKSIKEKRWMYLTYFLGIGLTLITIWKGFWTVCRPVLNSIQFPERLLFPANILLLISGAVIISTMSITHKQKEIIVGGTLILCAGLAIIFMNEKVGRIVYPSQTTIYEEIAGIGAGEEYLPVETKREMLTEPDIAYGSDGERVTGSKEKGTFTFTADLGEEFYTVPFIWYKGYAAKTDSGIRLETGKIPETSLLRVDMPITHEDENKNVTVRVWYEGTPFQKLCYLLNGIAVIVTAAGIIGRKYWLCQWETIRKMKK